MYVFEEFNKKHERDVSISLVGHQVLLAAVFWGGSLFLADATSLVNFTLAVLLVAHAARIFQISRSGDIVFTRAQIAVIAVTIPALGFLVAYAYFNASYVTSGTALFNLVFLPLLMTTIGSVWVDFFFARLFVRTPVGRNSGV